MNARLDLELRFRGSAAVLFCAWTAAACSSRGSESNEASNPNQGEGGAPPSSQPVDVERLDDGSYLADVVQLGAHSDLICAVQATGSVSCWGPDYLDRGFDAEPTRVPKLVEGIEDAREVVVSARAACAVTTGGGMHCWGDGSAIADADPDAPEYSPPAPIEGLETVVHATGGVEHFCALTADGKVWCFGRSNPFAVGRASSNHEALPVDGLEGVSDIAAGADPGCVLTVLYEDGRVECVAPDEESTPEELSLTRRRLELDGVSQLGGQCFVADGQAFCLGNWYIIARDPDTVRESLDPLPIPNLSDVRGAWSGGTHACALDEANRVYCWGKNDHAQLGQDYRSASILEPVEVSLPARATQVAAGQDFSCALAEDGHVLCWGSNSQGQIGDGTSYDALFPVPVRAPE